MCVDPDACERWRLVARGVAGGQGKTAGWHERTDLTFGNETVRALLGGKGHGELAAIAEAFEKDIKQVFMALRFGVAVGASSGRESDGVTHYHRQRGGAYAHRLHMAVDARFFDALEARFRARADKRTSAALRREFVRGLISTALRLLDEATVAAANSVFHRQRAVAKSVNAFWAVLLQPRSRLHDEPDIVARESFSRANEDEGDEGIVIADRVRFSVRDLSRQIAGLEPRQVHALCRGPLAGPGVAAFWQLVRKAVAPATIDNVDKWAALIQALAILARRRTPHPFTYAPARPMGVALFGTEISEVWLSRLLSARGRRRRDLAMRTCHYLTAALAHRFDLRTLARFLLVEDESTNRQIAREYYGADATAHRKGTSADA